MEIKGIIHAHSSYSYDGELSLTELRELATSRGFQFICMTEHTDELTKEKAEAFVRECDALSDSTFRFIPGFEVPFGRAHVLMVGMREFLGTYAESLNALRAWTMRAPFVILAHPVRNQFLVDNDLLSEIDALEVWNQQYEGKQVPRSRSLALFHALHAKKPTLVATGGVDLHRREHMGTPHVTLNVTELTEAQIFEKLTVGAFRVHSPRASLYGVLPNAEVLQKEHWWRSFCSVAIIVTGKKVNKTLAFFGLRFPSWLKQKIRQKI